MRNSDKPNRNATSTQDPFDRALTTLLKFAQHGKAAGCETWKDFLPIVARGERLSSEEFHDALMWHLAFCTHCRAEVKALAAQQEEPARSLSLIERLRAALARFQAQTASVSGAAATETLGAVICDASGNPTNERVQLELLATPYVSKSGFHLVVKAPGEWRGVALTVFIPEDAERYLFESGFTATVDEDGYVVMSGEDLGEEFDEDVQKIPPQMLEIYLQRKE
jgi:hypothetical protein